MALSFRIGLAAMLALALMVGCSEDEDDSTPPVTGTLSGKIIFHGEWPDSGYVQLSLFTNWNTSPCSWCGQAPGGPPAYYTERTFLHDPDTTNGAGPDTVAYTLSGITLGTYAALVVGWRAPNAGSDFNCDEPVVGMYGGDPYSQPMDSIPEPVVFTTTQASLNRDVHAYFDLVPVPGCDSLGRIEGVARVTGTWPQGGLLVMLTARPVSAWMPVQFQPTGYFRMNSPADSMFHFTPRFGTYYFSIWTNAAPPAPVQWYGSFGVNTAAGDARPDSIVINATSPLARDVVVRGSSPAPHWISGTVTFNGQRPPEGLLLLLSTFPFSPEHPPQGAPNAYYPITNPTETLYAFTGMAEDTFYVSLWNNVPPPTQPMFFGAYGYTHGSDTDPDPVIISQGNWGSNGINITGQP